MNRKKAFAFALAACVLMTLSPPWIVRLQPHPSSKSHSAPIEFSWGYALIGTDFGKKAEELIPSIHTMLAERQFELRMRINWIMLGSQYFAIAIIMLATRIRTSGRRVAAKWLLVATILMLMFPPWILVTNQGTHREVRSRLGYSSIFCPADPRIVKPSYGFLVRIDWTLLSVQGGIAILLAALFAFQGQRPPAATKS
ncbi:MAG: hypothetical protein AB7O66_09290 [Limisphaerales bacterium]